MKASRMDAEIEQSLRTFVGWMYSEPYNQSVGRPSDTGNAIKSKNQRRSLWIIPCSVNSSSDVTRTLEIPAHTELLCVAADSHASEIERIAQGVPTLMEAAENIDMLLDGKVSIKFDDETDVEVKKMPIATNHIKLDGDHPVVKEYGMGYEPNKDYELWSVFRYGIINSDKIMPGTHKIKMRAKSEAVPQWNEPKWESNVIYTITVK